MADTTCPRPLSDRIAESNARMQASTARRRAALKHAEHHLDNAERILVEMVAKLDARIEAKQRANARRWWRR